MHKLLAKIYTLSCASVDTYAHNGYMLHSILICMCYSIIGTIDVYIHVWSNVFYQASVGEVNLPLKIHTSYQAYTYLYEVNTHQFITDATHCNDRR